jgi:hypothetical protein
MRMGDNLNYSRVWNDTLNQLSGVSRIVKAGDGAALMSTTGKIYLLKNSLDIFLLFQNVRGWVPTRAQ